MFNLKNTEATKYLDVETDDLTVENLLIKYKIKSESNFVYKQDDDYKALITYVSNLYLENKDVPDDLVNELNENLALQNYIILNLQDRIENILSNNTTVVFKEIVTIVNILSFGKNFNIFENYNQYNIENLQKLFRNYEGKLQETKGRNEEKFNIIFTYYTILIETINELCTINATDILRKKTINPIIDSVTETINMLKFNVSLNKEEVNILNNILGKLLFYYSHIPYIETYDKDTKYLIEQFFFNFEKLYEGYKLSRNSLIDKNKQSYKIFLNSVTSLLLTLIYKLETNYTKDDYNDIDSFIQIIELYKKVIEHEDIIQVGNLNEFKLILLKNYNFIYNKNVETQDHLYVLNNFLENEEFNSKNMGILRSIVLFSSEIEENILIRILEILISKEKFLNDYYEFYKLHIFDTIINKFIKNSSFYLNDKLLTKLINYVDDSIIASHLILAYSKIYLSISNYYSFISDLEKNEKSKLYYYKFVNINGTNLLKKEFTNINDSILQNQGKRTIETMLLEEKDLENSKYKEIGLNILNKYFTYQELFSKQNINQQFANILTKIFTNENFREKELNQEIKKLISEDIFNGLAFAWIIGLENDNLKPKDIGYKTIKIHLIDEYSLQLTYSTTYKDVFNYIYERNKDFIKQNLVNLIITYIKSSPIYTDIITNLKNVEKLKRDLLTLENKEIIMVEFYINNLLKLNKIYGYEVTNKLFKEFSFKVNELISSYRLNGPKIGFILDENKDQYKSLINQIKDLKIEYKNEIIKPDLIFSVTWGNHKNILERSSHSISIAYTKEEKYNEFQ